MKKLVAVLMALLVAVLPAVTLAQETVTVYNWEDYIDPEVLDQFEEETGIKVNYICFTVNEDMLVQVEADPSLFDVIFPSEYCVERLLEKDLLAEINFDNVPNASYTIEKFANPDYDENGAHSVPYMWGTVGILYNKTMVDEPVDSWGILWDEKYKGQVFMLDSIRDSMGITLKYLGYSMNTRDPAALLACKDKLIEQKKAGIVKAYQVDETKDKMVGGEAALGLVWSGDAQYAIDLNSDLAYALPKEGSNVWVDAMVIPKASKNKENAEKFINFMCRPDIAQKNCEYIRYSSPNSGAIELMGEEYTSNPVMNPPEDYVENNCEFFHDIEQNYLTIFNTLWLEVKNAK